MASTFADATASTPDGGVDRAEIRTGWDIGGNANGGYLLGIVARSMARRTARPDPVTITAHFLRPGNVGPVSVETRVVKEGQRFSTATSLLSADAGTLLAVVGTFGELTPSVERTEDAMLVGAAPPELPDPDDCVAMSAGGGAEPTFAHQVDLRLHPDDATFLSGTPSGTPRVRGWFRLPHDEPLDTIALLLAVDSFPPTAFNAALPVGWTPTVELTAHVRARPAAGWLRAVFTTRFVTGGFLEEDGEVWDESGHLVAQSRQLALVPRPGGV